MQPPPYSALENIQEKLPVWEDPVEDAKTDTLGNNKNNDGKLHVNAAEASSGTFNGVVATGAGNTFLNTEDGIIWATGKFNAKVTAMTATYGAKAVNRGSIFLRKMTYVSRDKLKGMKANAGGTVVNEGLIYAKAGYGMYDQRDGDPVTMINSGTIVAEGNGVKGIAYNGFKDTKVSNEGTVYARNGATGIYVGNDFKNMSSETQNGKTLEVTGRILADADSTAIFTSETQDFTLILKGNAHIEGVSSLQSDATVVAENLNSDGLESLLLKTSSSPAKLKSVTLTDSDLRLQTTKGGGLSLTETLSFTGDSALHVGEGDSLAVARLTGNEARIVLETLKEDALVISENGADLTTVTVTDKSIDGMDAENAAQALQSGIDFGKKTGSDEPVEGSATWHGTNYDVILDTDMETHVETSELTEMTNDLAGLTLVAWRNETTTLADRMASLRYRADTYGVWARLNGGEYDYAESDMTNRFTTIEVGSDVTVSPNWTLGASFSYTRGEADLADGESESDAYAGALYALWTHEKGSFADLVLKTGRISNDFKIRNIAGDNFDKGTFEQTGFILSAETGHRFELASRSFVEPQVQLTYSRLSSVSETTAERRIDLKASDSLIGRIGLMAGVDCPKDQGTVFAKVSLLRDFRGDVDGTYSAVTGEGAVKVRRELDQNWLEFGLGADLKLTDSIRAFADVSRSAGGDIELDWRANAGIRMSF